MIAEVIWVAGIVLAVEGAIITLLPRRMEALLEAFRSMPPEARRLAGLAGLAAGGALLTLSRMLSA